MTSLLVVEQPNFLIKLQECKAPDLHALIESWNGGRYPNKITNTDSIQAVAPVLVSLEFLGQEHYVIYCFSAVPGRQYDKQTGTSTCKVLYTHKTLMSPR